MAFDPEAYLAEPETESKPPAFDPDEYLASESKPPAFDPDKYLSETAREATVGGVIKAGGKGVVGGVVSGAATVPGALIPAYEIATQTERGELKKIDAEIGALERAKQQNQGTVEFPYWRALFSGDDPRRLQQEAEAKARAGTFTPENQKRLDELIAKRRKVQGDIEAGLKGAEQLWGVYNDIVQYSAEKFGVAPDAPEAERVANLIGQGAGSLALAVGLSMALGPQFGGNVLAMQQAVDTYANQRAKGISPEQAALTAGIDFALTRKLEQIPLEVLTDTARSLPRVVRAAAGGVTEAGQEMLQQSASSVLRGDDPMVGLSDAGIAGGGAGAIVGALVPGRQRMPVNLSEQTKQPQTPAPARSEASPPVSVDQSTIAQQPTPGAQKAESTDVGTGPESKVQTLEVDLGEGYRARRAPDNQTWTLEDAQGNVRALNWDRDADADILRDLDPEENHRRVEQAVSDWSQSKTGPVKVQALRSVEDIPDADVRERLEPGRDEGVFIDRGATAGQPVTVYVFSDAVTPQRAPIVAAHEAVGHAGLRAVLGEKLDTTLDAIYGSAKKERIDSLAAALGLDVNTEDGRREATEELLARTAELADRDPAMWERVVVAVKETLRDLGFGVGWSDVDIAVLLARSREYVEGRRQTAARHVSTVDTPVGETPRNEAAPASAEAPAPEPQRPASPELFPESVVAIDKYPVQEVPLESLKLSKDVPNFKAGADDSGVVEPLAGKYERLGTAPIVVWERLNGDREIITGRHRADLARRTGEKTIPAQVVREADGFTKAMALTFDAESNIRDNQGSTRDYANYFRNTEISREEASSRGLLARDKGRAGYDIGKDASDDLYALYSDGKVSEAKAAAIARAAPGNADLQAVGIRYAKDHTAAETSHYLKAIQTLTPDTSAEQMDLFGRSEAWQIEADKMAKAAASLMRDLETERAALRAANKLGKAEYKAFTKRYGIHPGDTEAIQQRQDEIFRQMLEMEQWPTSPELTAMVREAAGLPAKEAVIRRSRPFQSDFSLEVQTPEQVRDERQKREQQQRIQMREQARAERAARQPAFLDTTGDLFDQRDAENPLFAVPTVRRSRSPAQRRADMIKRAKALMAEEVEGRKLRGFVDRVAPTDLVTDEQAARLISRPESWYEAQNYEQLNARLEQMDDAELAIEAAGEARGDTPSDQNAAALASAKLIQRYIDQGKDPSDLIASLSKRATVWAQLLRQMAEIKGARPESMMFTLQHGLEKQGYSIQPGKLERMKQSAERVIASTRALRSAQRLHGEMLTNQSLKAVELAERDAYNARREWLNHVRDVSPPSVSKFIVTMIKGNLLTVKSQIRNMTGNTLFAPLRIGADSIAAALDTLDHLITRRGRTILNPFVGTKEGVKAAGRALKQTAREFITGPVSDTVQGETIQGLRPLRALAHLFTAEGRESLPIRTDTGKVDAETLLLKAAEGTVGIHPEIMLRLLRFADDPIREGQRARATVEFHRLRRKLAEARGLQGEDLDRFVRTLDPEALKTIDEESRSAVFQQDNLLTHIIHSMGRTIERHAPNLKPYLDVFGSAVMPYTKTPTNLMLEGMKYAVPELSLFNAYRHFRKGDRRNGYRAIGQALVGYQLHLAAAWLIKEGLASGDPDKDNKGKRAIQHWMGANVINQSALERRLNGEPVEWREGDTVKTYRDFGFFGIILQMRANKQYRSNKEAWKRYEQGLPPSDRSAYLDAIIPSATGPLDTIAAVFQMSTLKGTADLLDALRRPDRDMDKWWNGYTQVFTAAMGIPNNLQSINRIRWKYLPDTSRSDGLADQFALTVKSRFSNRGIPLRRGLFGEPIKSTPEGADPVWYHFFDVSNSRIIPSNPRYAAVLSAWAQTNDAAAIPSEPDKTLKNPFTFRDVELTPAQHARAIELVGKLRGYYLDQIMAKGNWKYLTPEDKIKKMRDVYQKGREDGIRLLFEEQQNTNALKFYPPHIQTMLSSD